MRKLGLIVDVINEAEYTYLLEPDNFENGIRTTTVAYFDNDTYQEAVYKFDDRTNPEEFFYMGEIVEVGEYGISKITDSCTMEEVQRNQLASIVDCYLEKVDQIIRNMADSTMRDVIVQNLNCFGLGVMQNIEGIVVYMLRR